MSYADQNLKDIYQYHSNFERSERVYLVKKSGRNVDTFDRRERTWDLPGIICQPVKSAGQLQQR